MSPFPRSASAAFLDDQRSARPSSAPPDAERALPHTAGSYIPGSLDDFRINTPPHRPSSENPSRADMGIPPGGVSIDMMPQLQRSEPSVVKTRTGSVLSRGFILKTDYWPSGRALDLGLTVHGAPNFRAPRHSNLNVFGVAQPRTQGLRGILSVLRCRPNISNPTHVIWFSTREEPVVYISGRPFVLRDASEPRQTLKLSDRAENLEAIEQRLKTDILVEASKYGGLILTHNEIASDAGEGAIVPTWTAVDSANVRTMCELMENMRTDGWNVEYHRIPISPERPIEDNYLDAYLRAIKQTDPATTALVFNCGMGAVRTTFAMVAACIIRRKQLIERGMGDPYVSKALVPKPTALSSLGSQPSSMKLQQALEQASMQQDLNRSLLRITSILQQYLETKNSQTAIELLLTQPTLLDSLRKAHMGNYGIILSLLGCLDHGLKSKKLVDRVIDSCDQVTNLREDIFTHRVRYSLTTTMDETQRESVLTKAVRSLEKYFFIIAFAEYVDGQGDFSQSFSSWLKTRTEIWNQVMFLRKSYGSRLNVFAPINDLSQLSKTGSQERTLVPGQKNNVAIAGGQILGDEYSDHVVRNRGGIILREGTLLKSDQWLSESHKMANGVRGAINFRNIPNTKIYALGQPTLEAIDEVVSRVRSAHPEANRILWITLREEPIVYINGAPYCLRRERFTLRNMKDYGGISSSRLEVLEERLRDDVVSELNAFGGKLLLHAETPDGSVIPVWEDVESQNVSVLKDIMAARRYIDDSTELAYARIPITAERPPDFTDLSELIDVMVRDSASRAPIVINCQLGRGRSTMTAVVLLLIQQWLEKAAEQYAGQSPRKSTRCLPSTMSVPQVDSLNFGAQHRPRQSYQVINNFLRVVRRGPAVKSTVDDAIDQCAEVVNLRDSIEEARSRAEQATSEHQRRQYAHKGLQNLRRYFELMVFQSYLQSIEPDTMQNFESFESFVENRPVIKTFEKELASDNMSTLKPLERVDVTEGLALPDEVQRIVANRSGSILSASTILKSDFFSNLQKMSLPERIEGAPNFRRVPLTLHLVPSGSASPSDKTDFTVNTSSDHRWVCGCGMPTLQGLRNALIRVDAGPGGGNSVFWTSLREEPVIYVAGRPHVLRLVDKPLENVEATGVTTVMVEAMEENLKRDVIREVQAGEGRILLHDEVEERPGVFSIIPIWEDVTEDDIMTPRDVYDMVVKEGYKVNYDRVAVTDEQAPLPAALAQLLERVRAGLESGEAADCIFNCQMGRGRTTTGMVTACLIATTTQWVHDLETTMLESPGEEDDDSRTVHYDSIDGPSEEEAYLQGEYKTILQLVSVLSHGKMAKRLTDRAVDLMQDVQNLRRAIYDYKLKVNACEKGSSKQRKLMDIGINYLYRYGTLIVFANYLIEMKEGGDSGSQATFPDWLKERREITMLLSRRSLD